MPNFRYVAIQPGRIEQKQKLGPASYLHDFLVDQQTDAQGRVNYGRPFGYAWIVSRWASAPTIRTLKRHMARLKRLGHIEVKLMRFNHGMTVRVLGSAKWAPQAAEAAQQFPLFAPAPRSIRSGKACGNAVSKLSESRMAQDVPRGTLLSPHGGHFCPPKDIKRTAEETIKSAELALARWSPAEEKQHLKARRELLREQSELIQAKYKTSCG